MIAAVRHQPAPDPHQSLSLDVSTGNAHARLSALFAGWSSPFREHADRELTDLLGPGHGTVVRLERLGQVVILHDPATERCARLRVPPGC